jgi:hypothetical protein
MIRKKQMNLLTLFRIPLVQGKIKNRPHGPVSLLAPHKLYSENDRGKVQDKRPNSNLWLKASQLKNPQISPRDKSSLQLPLTFPLLIN